MSKDHSNYEGAMSELTWSDGLLTGLMIGLSIGFYEAEGGSVRVFISLAFGIAGLVLYLIDKGRKP